MGKEATPDGAPKVADLEQKYMSLLQRYIDELEAKLKKNGVSSTTGSESEGESSISSEEERAKRARKKKLKNKRRAKKSGKKKSKRSSPTPSESEEEAPKTDKKTEEKEPAKEKAEDKAEDAKEEDVETDKRYKHVLNEYNEKSGVFEDKPARETKKPVSEDCALTFRKYVTKSRGGNQQIYHSELVIHSQPLKKKLGEITKHYLAADEVEQISFPYISIVHCWDAAQKYANEEVAAEVGESEEEKQTREDWKKLLQFIAKSSGNSVVTQYFLDRDTLRESQMTTFEYLWTLFPKGALVVAKPYEDEPQVFIVEGCDGPSSRSVAGRTQRPFKIECLAYDWSGAGFVRVPYLLEIEPFSDKKAISELSVYPLNRHDRATMADFKARLIERGKKYVKFVTRQSGKQMFRYEGAGYHPKGASLFWHPKQQENDEEGSHDMRPVWEREKERCIKINVKGLVIIDFKSYFAYQDPLAPTLGDLKRHHRTMPCSCTDCQTKFGHLVRFGWDKSERDSTLEDEQYLCFPARALGYSLEHKRWVQLTLEDLREPDKADSTNFNKKLQLEESSKSIIGDAVKAHSMNKSKNINDYTPGKGKGLVILLWGLPGVGKTLTAESVAAMAGKPLFSVGVSDIGIEGSKVEVNLQNVFDLAGLWQAVLLFDEADVFLETRDATKGDIQRNTIVSVLLRVLEYYEGILILTTNRLRSFDIAVQSRIHLAIQYRDLTEGQREKIFLDFLSQLRDKDSVENWDRVTDWVDNNGKVMKFNGRQIRNVVSTAMSIANASNRPLNHKDLKTVAGHVNKFIEVLRTEEIKYRSRQVDDPYLRSEP